MSRLDYLAAHSEMASAAPSLFGVGTLLLMLVLAVSTAFGWVAIARFVIGGVFVFGLAHGLVAGPLADTLLALGIWSALPLVVSPLTHFFERGNARVLGETPPRFDPWHVYRLVFSRPVR